MTPRVVAALRELADAFEESALVVDVSAERRVVKRVRKGRVPIAPANSSVSDLDRAAVRAHLKRSGFIKVK